MSTLQRLERPQRDVGLTATGAMNRPFPPPSAFQRRPNPVAPAHLLTQQQWAWVEEFLLSGDIQRASVAAEYTSNRDLRDNENVRAALAQAQRFRSTRTAIHADMVLRRWWQLATADVGELVELRVAPCRHCWGWDHKFQYRDTEMDQATEAHAEVMGKREPKDRVEFDPKGGPGYTTNKAPNQDCPHCDGNGEPLVVFKDTRNLSAAGKLLYNGVEKKADGSIKLNIRDRGFAETMLAKHLGLLEKREPIRELDPARMTTAELEAIMDSLPPHIRQQVDAVFEALPELEVVEGPGE